MSRALLRHPGLRHAAKIAAIGTAIGCGLYVAYLALGMLP